MRVVEPASALHELGAKVTQVRDWAAERRQPELEESGQHFARAPGLERFEVVASGPQVLPLVIRSRTADGVDVVAMADLTLEVHRVEPGAEHVPTADVVRVAEETVESAVARVEVRSLVEDLAELEPRWPAEVGRRLPDGTEVAALAVTEVEARLA